jgi:hypothetical protein
MGAFLVWVGWDAFQTYGIRPADGGVLAPFHVRVMLGGGLALLGVALAGGILVYTRCYVARIETSSGSGSYRVSVAGFLRSVVMEIQPEELATADYHDGRYRGVDAPWYTVRVRGRRLPLIIDAQGEIVNTAAFQRLLAGQPPTAGRAGGGPTPKARKRGRR